MQIRPFKPSPNLSESRALQPLVTNPSLQGDSDLTHHHAGPDASALRSHFDSGWTIYGGRAPLFLLSGSLVLYSSFLVVLRPASASCCSDLSARWIRSPLRPSRISRLRRGLSFFGRNWKVSKRLLQSISGKCWPSKCRISRTTCLMNSKRD